MPMASGILAAGVLGTTAVTLALSATYQPGKSATGGSNNFLTSMQSGGTTGRSTGQDVTTIDGATVVVNVNRALKGDRGITSSVPMDGITISFQVQSLPATSVAMRVPASNADAMRKITSPPEIMKAPLMMPGTLGTPVACEPMVSVLTPIARLLPPGRCIT
jgi:hypothetical protein